MKINVQSIHFDADQRLLDLIDAKLRKLERYFDRIHDVEVILKLDNGGAQVKDKVVEVKLHLPGTMLFAKETTKTFEDSLHVVEESLKNQLTRHKERLRG
jgi:putative sigma-54 modulation protein